MKGSDPMIKKLFAVLVALLFVANIFSYNVLAAEISANKVDFIRRQNNNSNISKNNSYEIEGIRTSNLNVASNFQPNFNKFVDDILKIIFKIVPIQFADGTLNVSPKVLEERKAILKKKIIFENDIRLFTLYAFMNYTGYGEDSNNSEFNDVRNKAMNDLNKMNLKLSDNKYYSNKKVQFSYYINALRNMDSAPNFDIIGHKGNIIEGLLDLPISLEEFYLKADIEALYNKYKTYYYAEINKIEDKSLTALVIINNYLKIDNEDIPNMNIEINLLDAYNRNASFTSIDKYKGNPVITLGPSKEPDIQSLVHEYLHAIINPILDNLNDDVNKLSFISKEIPEYSYAKLYCNSWSANVEESIIKALEYRAVGESRKISVDKAMDEGFILTEYFDERFDEFKNYDGSLNDFIKSLLQDYNKRKK
jgi:hypothetical protein